MQAEWDPDELIGAWTLIEGDWDLIVNKAGVTRLGFVVMLKFYEIEGRVPRLSRGGPARSDPVPGIAGEGRSPGDSGLSCASGWRSCCPDRMCWRN